MKMDLLAVMYYFLTFIMISKYFLKLVTPSDYLSSLYLLGDIRDIREKRMKSEFTCMYLSFFTCRIDAFHFNTSEWLPCSNGNVSVTFFLYILLYLANVLFLLVWFTYFEITQHNFYSYYFHILFSCLQYTYCTCYQQLLH